MPHRNSVDYAAARGTLNGATLEISEDMSAGWGMRLHLTMDDVDIGMVRPWFGNGLFLRRWESVDPKSSPLQKAENAALALLDELSSDRRLEGALSVAPTGTGGLSLVQDTQIRSEQKVAP